jgi:L-alanine-DL-glutamate epimerase-like enolase superfamily enzyme
VRIRAVDAVWLHCPLDAARQHTSDFGRIASFDGVLVTVTTDDGLVGHGEAKPAVGSAGNAAAIVAIVQHELRPLLVGADAGAINALWHRAYNGSRAALAARAGRAMPALGRRGVHQAALAGVDLALWDLAGKRRGASVLELLGGACRERVPAYASGGWAAADAIGAELGRYTAQGFRAVKMRVGAMDGGVDQSLARVRAAREALGPGVELMVDAHGTMNVAEARRFCTAVADLGLRFVEEPVQSDDRKGLAEVRAASPVAIAAGESEASAYDFADLLAQRALDVLQPDLAIAGGLSEGLRIAALAEAHRLALAPHCWGSAISFQAARTLAFSSGAGVLCEVPMGGAPLLRELAKIDLELHDGALLPPRGPGFGVEPDPAFVREFTKPC